MHPSHWQFYLRRGNAEWASDQVSPEGYEAHLESIHGFVYVGTWTYGSSTSVTIELHDCEPTPALADHAVEVTLDGDGQLALLNWEPGDEPVARIQPPTGRMALRGSWTGLAAVDEFPEREVAGDRPSPEVIRFQIWPSAGHGPRLLRAWPSEQS